jgi:hypothetical protein
LSDPAKAIRKLGVGGTGGDMRGTKTLTTPDGRSGSKA